MNTLLIISALFMGNPSNPAIEKLDKERKHLEVLAHELHEYRKELVAFEKKLLAREKELNKRTKELIEADKVMTTREIRLTPPRQLTIEEQRQLEAVRKRYGKK